jgi:integrase
MAAVIDLPQSPFSAKRENVPPTRQPDQTSQSREYLTPDAVERMITTARLAGGRLAERDALLIMMAWCHGFRAYSAALASDRPKSRYAARCQIKERPASIIPCADLN